MKKMKTTNRINVVRKIKEIRKKEAAKDMSDHEGIPDGLRIH